MCGALNLKRGAYYSWTKRVKSARKREDDILAIEIKRVHKESGGTYGIRRIKAQLDKDGIRQEGWRLLDICKIYLCI